jgi:hypothetical protein
MPDPLDTPAVLRALGLRDTIHPADAFAFTYPNRAEFEESAAANRDLGNTVHGPWLTEAGVVAVVDIRPQLTAKGGGPTDPALPDDYWATLRRPQDLPGLTSHPGRSCSRPPGLAWHPGAW